MATDSITAEQTSELQEQLITAIELGDLEEAKAVFEKAPNLPLQYTDNAHRSPIQLAIDCNCAEILNLLQQHSDDQQAFDGFIYALKTDNQDMSLQCFNRDGFKEILLKYADPQKSSQSTHLIGNRHNSPLLLASIHNNLKIAKLLLPLGYSLPWPHDRGCGCRECLHNSKHFDTLALSLGRIDILKGLASPAHLILANVDPVNIALDLLEDLYQWQSAEPAFKDDYSEIIQQVKKFLSDLLEFVDKADDLNVLLDKEDDEDANSFDKLSCLLRAVQLKAVRFVAHPKCQQLIGDQFYEGCQFLLTAGQPKKLFLIITFPIWFLFVLAVYVFFPNSKIGKIAKVPAFTCMAEFLLYVLFLILVLVRALTETAGGPLMSHFGNMSDNFLNCWDYGQCKERLGFIFETDFNIRKQQFDWASIAVYVFVLAMFLHEIVQLYYGGYMEYTSSYYNLMDSLSICFYAIAFTLTIATFYRVSAAVDYFSDPSGFANFQSSDGHLHFEATRQFYWILADRWLWEYNDPMLISEGFFAAGNVLTGVRMSYIYTTSEKFGPMKISLGRMIRDIGVYATIVFTIFIGFFLSFMNLFWYYDPNRHQGELICQDTCQPARSGASVAAFQSFITFVFVNFLPFYYFLLRILFPHDSIRINGGQNK